MQFMIQTLMNSKNPQQALQNMMMQNPQMSAIMNQVKNSGMSMEQYVRQYAKQNNINIDNYINTFKRSGAKF